MPKITQETISQPIPGIDLSHRVEKDREMEFNFINTVNLMNLKARSITLLLIGQFGGDCCRDSDATIEGCLQAILNELQDIDSVCDVFSELINEKREWAEKTYQGMNILSCSDRRNSNERIYKSVQRSRKAGIYPFKH